MDMQTATPVRATVQSLLPPQVEQEYQLPPGFRESVLSRSKEGRRTLLIERQRQAFIAIHGDAFGADVL